MNKPSPTFEKKRFILVAFSAKVFANRPKWKVEFQFYNLTKDAERNSYVRTL
jgi:hypothetical protein